MARKKTTKPKAPRILVLDIELSPITAYVWQTRDVNIGLDQILHDWSVIAWAARWLDGKHVTFRCTGGRGAGRVRDDKAILEELAKLLEEAELVIGHNVKSFDMRKIRSRMMEHGMAPPSPVAVIDTLTMARRAGAFTSNKLKALCDKLTEAKKDDHSAYPGMSLWTACLQDDPKAWEVMAVYNKADINATADLYMRLRSWASTSVNLATYSDTDEPACPTCQSTDLSPRGTAVTSTGRFSRVLCNDCGSWSRTKQNLIPSDQRKSKLTKA